MTVETINKKYSLIDTGNHLSIKNDISKLMLLSCSHTQITGCCSGRLLSGMIFYNKNKSISKSDINEIMYILEQHFHSYALLLYVYSTATSKYLKDIFELRQWKHLSGFPGAYSRNYTLDIYICNPKYSEPNYKNIPVTPLVERKSVVKKVTKKVKKKNA